jgi:AbrB family looped-hinge helix DNA binding protein
VRVTSKGQVTIPKRLRQRTGIGPGADVDFVEQNGQVVVKRAERKRRPSMPPADEFAAYLDRVTGIVDLGMSSDEFMELLRGE